MSREQIKHSVIHATIFAAAQYANQERATGAADGSSTGSNSWCGGLSLDESIHCAEQGGFWADGARMMGDAMAITDGMMALAPLPLIKRHVEGGAPCVPAAIMGHPKSMFKRAKRTGMAKPTLSIGVSILASSRCSASAMINRGAAVLTAISELESQGYQCELVAVWRGGCREDLKSSNFKKWFNWETTVKAPEATFNPASVAFMLAHPCSLRRLGFKVLENTKGTQHIQNSGYGQIAGAEQWRNSMASDFDIVFDNMRYDAGYDTPEAAMESVQEQITTQMAHFTESAA